MKVALKKTFIVCLILFPLLLSAQVAKNTIPCRITIVSPKDNERVAHNGKLWTYFTFIVKGTVTNLGQNQLCLYQKKSMDDNEWWRSGSPILLESLKNGNEFQIDYATCGGSLNRHKECYIYIVVQQNCPNSGDTVQTIQADSCRSEKIRIFPKGLFE